MPDNLKIKRPEDSQKININEQWEVDYWIRALSVSEFQLRNAVKAFGPVVWDVNFVLIK